MRFFLCKTFPWKGKGSAQPIPKGSQKKALPVSMKVHFQEKLVRFFLCKGGSHNYVELIFDFLTSMLLQVEEGT